MSRPSHNPDGLSNIKNMEELSEKIVGEALSCSREQIAVSVIIPAFNAAPTIGRALDSVRAQTGVGAEVLIIDDASADNTVEVVKQLIRRDENIRLIRMPKNGGASAARNAGIREARGRYLAFLDADDIWLPGKLLKQFAAIEADPDVTLVTCNSQMTSAAGVPLKEGHVNRPPVAGKDAWKTLLVYNFLPTPTILTHTDMVRELGGFDEALAVGEDLDLWIKLAVRGKVAVLPEILINYYDMNNSLMKRHSAQTGDIVVPMLERHIREQGGKLTRSEVRAMRGSRSFRMACDLFFSDRFLPSIPLFLQAAACGIRPVKSVSYLPRALLMESATQLKRVLLKSNH
jgi:glycosyltransferase involved in cell wall biosynthesis